MLHHTLTVSRSKQVHSVQGAYLSSAFGNGGLLLRQLGQLR